MKLKVIHVNPGEKLKRFYLNNKIIQESLVLRNIHIRGVWGNSNQITKHERQ